LPAQRGEQERTHDFVAIFIFLARPREQTSNSLLGFFCQRARAGCGLAEDGDLAESVAAGIARKSAPPSKWMELDFTIDGGTRTDTIAITTAILKLIAEIDEFKGAWTAIGRILPERLTALRRVATIESIGSSTRIEGARLSDKEVDALVTGLEVKEFASRDEEEVAGYAETMETVFPNFKEIALTENRITRLNRDLLQYSSKDEHHRGEY
jgi:hypothetical protein